MKKVLAVLLSVLLVIGLVPLSMLISVGAATTVKDSIPTGKADKLRGLSATFRYNTDKSKTVSILTDGVIADSSKDVFLNESIGSATAGVPYTVDGKEKKYVYAFEFATKSVTVDSFTVTWTGSKGATPNENYDTEIEVLISTDKGKTWTSAYLQESGTNFGPSSDTTKDSVKYKIATKNLKKEYKDVTNIVYAAVKMRKSGGTYVSRVSEISFFGTDVKIYESKPATGKVDVLTGVPATYYTNTASKQSNTTLTLLTDGVIACDGGTNVFANKKTSDSSDNLAPTVAYTVDGQEKMYCYAFKFDTDHVSVDSFRVTWTGEQGASSGKNYDGEIEVLISTDNGDTWTSAYLQAAGTQFGPGSDTTDATGQLYKIAEASLKQTYSDVTNIIYAAVTPRVNGGNYCARISEISFFGPEKQSTSSGWHLIAEDAGVKGSLVTDADGFGNLTSMGKYPGSSDFMVFDKKIDLSQTFTLQLDDLYCSDPGSDNAVDRWCAVSLLSQDAIFSTDSKTKQKGITLLIKNGGIYPFAVPWAEKTSTAWSKFATKSYYQNILTATTTSLSLTFSYNSSTNKYSIVANVNGKTKDIINDGISTALASLGGTAYLSVGIQSGNECTTSVKAHLLPSAVPAEEFLNKAGHKAYWYDSYLDKYYSAADGKTANLITDSSAWLAQGGAGYLPSIHEVCETNRATLIPQLESYVNEKDSVEARTIISNAFLALNNFEANGYTEGMTGDEATAALNAIATKALTDFQNQLLAENKLGWHLSKQNDTAKGGLAINGNAVDLESNGSFGADVSFAITDKPVNIDAEDGVTVSLKNLISKTASDDRWLAVTFLSSSAMFEASNVSSQYKGVILLIRNQTNNTVQILNTAWSQQGNLITRANSFPKGGANIMTGTAESMTITLKKVGGKYTLIFNDGEKASSVTAADAAFAELGGEAYIAVGLNCGDKAQSNVTVELLANKVAGLAPTETDSGYKAYYKNQLNDRLFEDAAQTMPIADFKAWSSKGGAGYIPDLLHQDVVASNAVIDASVNGNSCDINSITDIVPNADIIIHAENNIDVMAFSFAPDAIQEIADYIAGSEYSLIILMKDGSIKLGSSAMAVIGEKLNGSQFDLTLHYPAGPGDVTDEQIDAIGKYQVADLILVRMFAGKTVIRDFGDAELEIGFDGTLAKPVQALYLADDGKVERVPTTVRDGKVYLTTNHLSLYGYAEEEKVAIAELADAKEEAKEVLSSANAADPLLNEAVLKAGYAAIDSSATVADVTAAKSAAIANIQAAQVSELAAAKSSAIAELEAENAKDPVTNPAPMNTGRGKLNNAETKADVASKLEAAKDDLHGYQAMELAAARQDACDALDAENRKDTLIDETALNAAKQTVNSSATKAAVSSALAAGIGNVQAAQAEELKDTKSSAVAVINETAAQGDCSSAIVSSALDSIAAAKTKAEVEIAKLAGIEAIENDIFSGNLGGAKKLALDALAAQNELDPIDNEALLTELQNLINSSATVEAVNSNKEAAIAFLKAEQKTELEAAIAAAKIAIEAADNADELNSSAVKDAGKKAVESGATKADVAEILSAAIADVNVAVAQELADAKTAAKADIDAQNEYDPLIDSSSVAAAYVAIDAAATKRAVAAALNEGLRSVKNAQRSELSDALSAALTDVHNANAEDPLEGVNALAEIAMWLNFLNLDQSIKTKADAAEELSSAIAAVKGMQLNELNAEKAEVLAAVNAQNEKDPLIDSTAIRSAALLVDEAATKAAVRAIADEAMQLVKDAQAEELAAAKEDALEVLSSANAVDPLIDTAALDNANTAVENATTKAEVKQYKEAGVSNIAAAQAEELAAAKEAASSAIANGFNDARIYPENKAELIESQQDLVNGAKTKAEVAALLSKAEELIQAAEDNDVAAAKQIVIDELNTINDADPITSTAVLSAAIDAVNACDTITGVVSASTGLYDTVRAEQALELADAKAAAKAALDAEDAKDPLNDKTALNDAKNAVDAMTTKALVEGARSSGIAAVQQAQAIELKAAQDEAVKAVREEIKNDTNAKVLATAETEIGKINATGKKAEVEPAKTAAIQAVKDMRALVAAQEAAEAELNVAAGNKPSDAVKAIVSDGIAAIEAAATPAKVSEELTAALNRLYAQRAAEGLEKYCMLEGTELVDVTTASDAIYVSNAAFSKFVKVTVDSNALTAADFTVVEGSTRVTLKAAYLKTLANGTHTIEIDSGDGVAKYTFTVVGQAPAPDTGDHTMIYIAAVTAIIALGITALVAKKKREEI